MDPIQLRIADMPRIPTRPPPNPMPSVTESILRCMELSTAVEEAQQFVRRINDMEAELGRTTDARQYVKLHGQLVECREVAKTCMEQYQRLADIWTGAEFNLVHFLGGICPAERDRMYVNALFEEERMRAMEAEVQRASRVQEEMMRSHHAASDRGRRSRARISDIRFRTIVEPLWPPMATEVTDIPELPVLPRVEIPELPVIPVASVGAPASPAPPTHPLPTTLPELIAQVENEAQKQALSKLLYRMDVNQMYLASYEANGITRGRGSDVEGTFTVLGTMRHGSRESYTVKWYRVGVGRPSFWCTCPDHKFNSARKNMVCKHICFLVSKVGRILDPAFYASRQFTEAQQSQFRETVGNAAIFSDGARERERLAAVPTIPAGTVAVRSTATASQEGRRAQFMELRRPVGVEDSCPICYDEMAAGACLNCPTCSNNVHRECMEVWLERNSSCVYCRSDVWRFY